MVKTAIYVGVGVIVTLALLATFGLVSAHWSSDIKDKPGYDSEKYTAMQETYDNLDYDGWVALMQEYGKDSEFIESITEENFETYVAMNKAKMSGDIETAKELAEELGLWKDKSDWKDKAAWHKGKFAGKGDWAEMHKGKFAGKGYGGCSKGCDAKPGCPYTNTE
ncbi:hypothetical protein GOV14_05835 [Candidatus Pacearchaeota archaeon]|nr:hypothetical protein [Candidatus Pacearchaeota archaeon]